MVVAPNTTPGLLRDHADLMQGLSSVGATAVAVTSAFGILNHARIGRPLDEMVVTSSLAYAVRRALERFSPRALLLATSQTGLLFPTRLLRRSAIRFDGLAASTRPDPRDVMTRALERRCLREARLLLPYTDEGAAEATALVPRRPLVVWPSPVRPGPVWAERRRRGAVCYANNPDKKGLDLAVQAWALAAPVECPLFVTGIDEPTARRFLGQRNVAVPENVRFCGRMPEDEYRGLSASVDLHLGASRVDEFATTQLEALIDGALLVTVPSAGPIAPLSLARELDQELVAPSVSVEGLVVALRHVWDRDDVYRAGYRQRAARLMARFTPDTFRDALRNQILPMLLA
jgi:hypothetical protein